MCMRIVLVRHSRAQIAAVCSLAAGTFCTFVSPQKENPKEGFLCMPPPNSFRNGKPRLGGLSVSGPEVLRMAVMQKGASCG